MDDARHRMPFTSVRTFHEAHMPPVERPETALRAPP
jgi:hypothetical protein